MPREKDLPDRPLLSSSTTYIRLFGNWVKARLAQRSAEKKNSDQLLLVGGLGAAGTQDAYGDSKDVPFAVRMRNTVAGQARRHSCSTYGSKLGLGQ